MSYAGLNKKVFDKMPKQEVELSKMEVELAVTDQVSTLLKQVQKTLADYNKADNKIQAIAKQINDLYKPINANKGYAGRLTKIIDGHQKNAEKLFKELGVPMQGSDLQKQLSELYSLASQIDDTMSNAELAIKSIGK